MHIKRKLISFLDKLPYIRGIKRDILNYEKWGYPGHFYNPIPSIEEVLNYEYSTKYDSIHYLGIDLNINNQWKLIEQAKDFYLEIPFTEKKSTHNLYYFENPNYSYADAIFYYFIIRLFRPKKIIEVGSGFSTCVSIDVNEIFFDNKIKLTSIDPYPDLLLNISQNKCPELIKSKVQEVDVSVFQELEENDILFIDSSHVLKAGSDLNHLFFHVIPQLKDGVLIHFHDIFHWFRYPKEWIINEHRGWNEIYALKLFLMYNNKFEIQLFNNSN